MRTTNSREEEPHLTSVRVSNGLIETHKPSCQFPRKQHLLALCLQPPAQTGAMIDLEHVLEGGEGDRSSEGAEPAMWLKVREVFWRLIIFIFGPFRA